MNTQVLVCPNCKGKTQFNFGNEISGSPNANVVCTGQCIVCKAVVLAYGPNSTHVQGYFPTPEAWVTGDPGGVPPQIWADFIEAVVCRWVNACKATAVLCRRAVQGVAIEKKIPNGTPYEQIVAMEEHRLITPVLKDAAHQIRVFGNVGAHPGDDGLDTVSPEEADAALTFIEELLDHMYRLPARLQRFQPSSAPP